MTLWTQVKNESFNSTFFGLMVKETFENISLFLKQMWSLSASFSTCPLACLKFVLFHPLQELSVQLFGQLEKDTKGSEEEADGKGWYQFACVHKVCFRNFVSVARHLAFLKGAKCVRK